MRNVENPSSSDTDGNGSGEEADEEDTGRGSPFSAIHLGAPPPPPPSLPNPTGAEAADMGELTPPTQLTTTTMSPIEKTHERFNFRL